MQDRQHCVPGTLSSEQGTLCSEQGTLCGERDSLRDSRDSLLDCHLGGDHIPRHVQGSRGADDSVDNCLDNSRSSDTVVGDEDVQKCEKGVQECESVQECEKKGVQECEKKDVQEFEGDEKRAEMEKRVGTEKKGEE